MDVSIIIVNYKTKELVVNCISSIIKKTNGISYEIIIVDNNSNDGCQQTLNTLFPNEQITFLMQNTNIGFGKANNEGIKIAKGRNILFLNPDTVLINNAIKELSFFLDDNMKVGICGGNLYDENMIPTQSFFRTMPSITWELSILTFRKIEKLVYRGSNEFNLTKHPIEVGYITGADLMTRREVLDEIGYFSPDFFMYYEETDLCCRARKHGYKVVNIPTAKIQHLEGRSFDNAKSTVNEKKIKMMEESRLTYYNKNTDSQAKIIIANHIHSIALSINKIAFKLIGRNIWKEYDCRKRIFKELLKQQTYTTI